MILDPRLIGQPVMVVYDRPLRETFSIEVQRTFYPIMDMHPNGFGATLVGVGQHDVILMDQHGRLFSWVGQMVAKEIQFADPDAVKRILSLPNPQPKEPTP